jgi:cell division protein FtsA
MVSGDIFAAIDIGSSKIKTLIGSFSEDKKLRILGVGVVASNGVRKGNILDMDEFRSNIDSSLSEAEKMIGEHVDAVYISLSGISIESVVNSGIVAVSGTEVTDDDVNRALDMSQNGVDLQNRTVLKVVPESFSLDGTTGIKNPVGIISISESALTNIKKGISDVGVDIADIFANVLSAPEAVLTRRQRELGVVCIDIGASTTDIAVFEE